MSTRKEKKYNKFESELKRLGLTQSELARILKVDRQVIHNWIVRGSLHAHKRFLLELAGLGFKL